MNTATGKKIGFAYAMAAMCAIGAFLANATVDPFYNVTLKSTRNGGNWSDPATWTIKTSDTKETVSGITPGDNARITLGAQAGYSPEVILDSNVTNEFRLLYFNPSAGGSITLDGSGTRLVMPYSDSGYYEETALTSYNGRYFFRMGKGSDLKDGVLDWYNPRITVRLDSSSNGFADLYRGVFNFRDPGGVVSSRILVIGENRKDGMKKCRVMVHEGVTLLASKTQFDAARDGDEFVINGATCDLGEFSAMCDAAVDFGRDVFFTVTNNASVTMKSFQEKLKGASTNTVCFNMNMSSSSLAVTNGSFSVTPNISKAFITLTDSTIAVTNGSFALGSAAKDNGEVRFAATNSVIAAGSDISIGATGSTAGNSTVSAMFYSSDISARSFKAFHAAETVFSNCTVNIALTNTVYSGTTVTYKDCNCESYGIGIGEKNDDTSVTGPAKIVLDGGSYTIKDNDAPGIGCLKNGSTVFHGVMVLTNGATVNVGKVAQFQIGRYRSYGELFVDDGTFTVSDGNLTVGDWSDLAAKSATGGHLRIAERGRVEVNGAVNISRYRAEGLLEVLGGELSCTKIVMERNAYHTSVDKSVTNRFVQSGGAVKISDTIQMSEGSATSEIMLTGGYLETKRIFHGPNSIADTTLVGNGGKLRAIANTTSDPFLSGVTDARVGANGLEIDTNGKKISVVQSFTNIDGEEGVFSITGGGSLALLPTSGWDVSRTTVNGATLVISNASETLHTRLELSNDAVLSLAGNASSLELDGLAVSAGIIRLDPGDVITVPGSELELGSLRIEFTSLPSFDTPVEIFRCDGTISADARRSLLRAVESMSASAGTQYMFSVEEVNGTMIVKATYIENTPISDETSWNGTSGAWSTPDGWSAGVPSAETKAVFPADVAQKEVLVSANAQAGALSIAGGYALEGGLLTVAGAPGAAEIAVLGGTNAISSPMVFSNKVNVSVAADSALSIAGDVSGKGFVKEGTGMAEFSGTNDFAVQVVSGNGILKVPSVKSLGCAGDNDVVLKRGTLWIGEGDPEVVTNRVLIAPDDKSHNCAIRNDRDVTVENLSLERGGLVKRGSGKLTVKVKDGMELAPEKRTKNNLAWNFSYDFADDGTIPDNDSTSGSKFYVAAMGVAEGELEFVPAEGETKPTVNFKSDSLVVGMQVADRGGAKFTADGVRVNVASGYFDLGYNLQNTSGHTVNKCPEARLINGAELTGNVLRFGATCFFSGNRELLAVTNGSVRAETSIVLSSIGTSESALNAFKKDAKVMIRALDSEFATASYQLCGGIDAEFSNTVFGPYSAGKAGVLNCRNTGTAGLPSTAYGTMAFVNGSVFRVSSILGLDSLTNKFDEAVGFTLAFDDAEWDYGGTNYTLAASTFNKYAAIEMRGTGVRLKPPAGTTFTTCFPFSGEGGVKNEGAGTVAFGEGTVAFGGTLDVGTGVADLSAAGAVSGLSIAGSGTVRGAAFGNDVTLKVTSEDGSTVTGPILLEDCTFPARMRVDFGRTSENPMDEAAMAAGLAVARILGEPPAKIRLSMVNTGIAGFDCTCTARIEDGMLKVCRGGGFAISFR